MMRRLSALVVGLVAISAGSAFADVKAGVDAWSRGEYPAAIKEWQGPAASGDADAQFNLGQAYKLGRGVKQDLAKAEQFYSQAAGKGHLQAADNYGLLLFHRGARDQALPYLKTSADRGDGRAQYLLGIGHFNGDLMPKDWVRAYALVSLAHQSGLPQAAAALAQMDTHIPLAQRQASVAVASELAARAEANRSQQYGMADLGATTPEASPAATKPVVVAAAPKPVPIEKPAAIPAPTPTPKPAVIAAAPQGDSPRTAGADFARPGVVATPRPSPVATPVPAPKPVAAPAPKPVAPVAKPASTASGWRLQMGAFGVRANADALWNRIKSRPEIAGHGHQMLPTGKVVRLMVTGFGSSADAQTACAKLSSGGFQCLVVRD